MTDKAKGEKLWWELAPLCGTDIAHFRVRSSSLLQQPNRSIFLHLDKVIPKRPQSDWKQVMCQTQGDKGQQVWHICLQVTSGRQEAEQIREGHLGTQQQQVPGVNTSQEWWLVSWSSWQSQASRTVSPTASFSFLHNNSSYQIQSSLLLPLRRHGWEKGACLAGENNFWAEFKSDTKPTKEAPCFGIISVQCVAHFKAVSTSTSKITTIANNSQR